MYATLFQSQKVKKDLIDYSSVLHFLYFNLEISFGSFGVGEKRAS